MTLNTILVVDDVPDNLEILGSILSPDYDVLVATNGNGFGAKVPGPADLPTAMFEIEGKATR